MRVQRYAWSNTYDDIVPKDDGNYVEFDDLVAFRDRIRELVDGWQRADLNGLYIRMRDLHVLLYEEEGDNEG